MTVRMKTTEDPTNTNIPIRTQRELLTSLHIDSSRSNFFTRLFREESNIKFGQSVRQVTAILITFIVSFLIVSALKSGRVQIPSHIKLHFVNPKEANIIFILVDSIPMNALRETVTDIGVTARAGTAVILEGDVNTPKSKALKKSLLSDKDSIGNEKLLWVFAVAPDVVSDFRGRIFSDNQYFSVINIATNTELVSCIPQRIATDGSTVRHRLEQTTSKNVIIATNYLVDIPSKFPSIFTVAPVKDKSYLTVAKGGVVEKDIKCPFVSAVMVEGIFKFQCVSR